MMSLGLNTQGSEVALGLNPHPPVYFDPDSEPSQTIADAAGVVRNEAHGASVTVLVADGSGIVRAMADGTAVTTLAADGAGIVRTSADGAES